MNKETMKINRESLALLIGFKIKHYRNKAGLNQTELAALLSVSRPSIANYEGGLLIPRLNVILELTDIFNVKMCDLIPSDKEDFIVAMDKIEQSINLKAKLKKVNTERTDILRKLKEQ